MFDELTCEQCQERIPWYVNATSRSGVTTLEQHLADCKECQQVLREWQSIVNRMRVIAASSPALPDIDQSWTAIRAALAIDIPDGDIKSGIAEDMHMYFDDQPARQQSPLELPTRPARVWPGKVRALISVATLVTLFLGILVRLQVTHQGTRVSAPLLTPHFCSATTPVTNGFTGTTPQLVSIDHADADLSGLNVFSLKPGTYILPNPYISDCMGNNYPSIGGMGGSGVPGFDNIEYEYPPLFDNAPGQTVTLFYCFTLLSVITPDHMSTNHFTGLWQIPFTVHIADNADIIPMKIAPIVHEGLAITPTYVAWLNDITPDTAIEGNMRIHLHLTGLPHQWTGGGIGTQSLCSAVRSCSYSSGANLMQLRLPDGQLINPTSAEMVDDTVTKPSATGQADIDLIFYTPLMSGSQMSELVINDFSIGSFLHPTTYSGPWMYQIPNP